MNKGVDSALISASSWVVDDLRLGPFAWMRLAICLEEVFDDERSDEALRQFVAGGDIVGYFSCRFFREYPAVPQRRRLSKNGQLQGQQLGVALRR